MRKNNLAIRRLYLEAGRAVRNARVAEGLLQRELASRIGITLRMLQRVEGAETPIPLHLLVAVADELDLSLDELVPVTIEERKSA